MTDHDAHRLIELVPRLAGRKVVVIGDFVADRYVLTEPARLSREAPVMIARYQSESLIPGGAANTVGNLLALGAEVAPVGLVGDDADGSALISHFEDLGVDVGGVIRDPGSVTVTKTRVMVGDPNRMKQQVLRIDRDPEGPPSEQARAALVDAVRERLTQSHALLLSDYGYGVVGEDVTRAVEAGIGDAVLTADSRYRIDEFRNVHLATPNEGEVEEAVGFRIRDTDDLERAGNELRTRIGAPALLVTRGKHGMALFTSDAPRLDIPATGSHEVTDVSGAGDTVIAVATLARAAGADFADAARLANLAAGIVVMKPGAATCSADELEAAIRSHS